MPLFGLRSPTPHHAGHALTLHVLDLDAQEAIIQEGCGSGPHVPRQPLICRRDLTGCRPCFRGKNDPGTGRKLPGLGQGTHPDAGTPQVNQDRRRVVSRPGLEDSAQLANPAFAHLDGAMGRIDAHHVDAGVEERAHLLG
jgi:hypothetical protein